MKKNYTSIIVLIDKSGSMEPLKAETISGYNSFIEDHQKVDGECTVTLVQFDDRYEENYSFLNIHDIMPLNEYTYKPRGWTKLRDAMGRLIKETGEKFDNMKEEDRPEKVIFAIITDGQDNQSSEFSKTDIKKMVEHQENKYNWEFIYLAANQNAVLEGGTIGIKASKASQFEATGQGVTQMYNKMSANTIAYRTGVKKNLDFEETK